jgi:4'-phosphopantetheinyl transferase EntD
MAAYYSAGAGMIERLFPEWAAAVEAYDDPPDATLFPAETALIDRAVAKRRLEFTTVRVCARAALGRLGLPPVPILHGVRGAPGWPAGVVGSMTHCAGYRAAVVALNRHASGLGVDAEPHAPLPEGVLTVVARPEEQAWLAEYAAQWPLVHWDRLLFSAKESVYKVWSPMTGGVWLDFEEASLTFDPVSGTFTARLLVPGPVVDGRELTGLTGRYLVDGGLAVTAIAVPVAAA